MEQKRFRGQAGKWNMEVKWKQKKEETLAEQPDQNETSRMEKEFHSGKRTDPECLL